jgi:hypothetical protein
MLAMVPSTDAAHKFILVPGYADQFALCTLVERHVLLLRFVFYVVATLISDHTYSTFFIQNHRWREWSFGYLGQCQAS